MELIDPSISDSHAVEARCRLCGREEVKGQMISEGQRFETMEEVLRALTAWAEHEGESSIERFCQNR